jgi:hypothetical protein
MVSSGYGVVSTLSGAWLLSGPQFTRFSLILLIQQFLLQGFRSAIGDASLVNVRFAGTGPVGARHAVIWWLALSPVTLGLFTAFGVSFGDALVLLGLGFLANLHDCLRYRGIHVGRVWVVLWSDVARALTVVGIVIACFVSRKVHTGEELAAYLWLAAIVGVLVMLAGLWRHPDAAPVRLRDLRAIGAWQLAEFLIAQAQTSLPLVILGAISGAPAIGAFRLAQTFMGPVNLVSAALATNLLAQVTTLNRVEDGRVVAMADQLGRRIVAIGAASTVGGLVIVLVPGAFPAISTQDLVLAVTVVGVTACSAGFASPHLVALRVLMRQRFLTVCAALIVVTTWAGFLVGYAVDGVELSLVMGFIGGAIAFPVLLLLPARRVYRQAEARRDADVAARVEPMSRP